MRRSVLALALVLGSSGVAGASPYIGLGIGPSGSIGNDTKEDIGKLTIFQLDAAGRSAHLLGGYRFPKLPFIGAISIEGSLAAYGLVNQYHGDYSARNASLSGKYSYPLAAGFEVFGRLGLNQIWIKSQNTADSMGRSGGGILVGLGAEYRFKLPMAQASAFLDYSYGQASFDEGAYTRQYSARMWTLGFTMGI